MAAERAAAAGLDAALIARALGGSDTAAFGQLVRRHQGTLRARLRRLTRGDHALADDLAQETFLTAWRKLHQFRAEARFSTWLYRIAYTTFLQARRGKRVDFEPQSEEHASSEDLLRSVALQRDLSAALSSLPEAHSAALHLCYECDLSHEEAAYVLCIPVSTVKTHIARGKEKLRERLSAWGEEVRQPEGTAKRC
jgi:RNA polymerase sigma-70 factor (ECF subfamily)